MTPALPDLTDLPELPAIAITVPWPVPPLQPVTSEPLITLCACTVAAAAVPVVCGLTSPVPEDAVATVALLPDGAAEFEGRRWRLPRDAEDLSHRLAQHVDPLLLDAGVASLTGGGVDPAARCVAMVHLSGDDQWPDFSRHVASVLAPAPFLLTARPGPGITLSQVSAVLERGEQLSVAALRRWAERYGTVSVIRLTGDAPLEVEECAQQLERVVPVLADQGVVIDCGDHLELARRAPAQPTLCVDTDSALAMLTEATLQDPLHRELAEAQRSWRVFTPATTRDRLLPKAPRARLRRRRLFNAMLLEMPPALTRARSGRRARQRALTALSHELAVR